MSTGYSLEGVRQVGLRSTLLGARHVPERLCGGYVYLGRYNQCSTFTFTFLPARRYASAGYSDRNVSVCLSVCPSVCPSVRHAPVLCQNEES